MFLSKIIQITRYLSLCIVFVRKEKRFESFASLLGVILNQAQVCAHELVQLMVGYLPSLLLFVLKVLTVTLLLQLALQHLLLFSFLELTYLNDLLSELAMPSDQILVTRHQVLHQAKEHLELRRARVVSGSCNSLLEVHHGILRLLKLLLNAFELGLALLDALGH